MAEFNIITWLKNKVGFEIKTEAIQTILLDRGLQNTTEYDELTEKDKDLLVADLLFYLWTGPTQTAAKTWSHGDQTRSIGSQTIANKDEIYKLMISLYRKWNDSKADVAENMTGGVQWINEF